MKHATLIFAIITINSPQMTISMITLPAHYCAQTLLPRLSTLHAVSTRPLIILMPTCRHPQIIQEIHNIQAKNYVHEIQNIEQPALPLDNKKLKEFLDKRVTQANYVLSGRTDHILYHCPNPFEKEKYILDSAWAEHTYTKNIKHNPNIRAHYYYPKIISNTLIHAMRLWLGCYARIHETCDAIESLYVHQLEELSIAAYLQRLTDLLPHRVDHIRVQMSKDFAQTVLQLLEEAKEPR